MQTATDELADFFGESSEGGSDDDLHARRNVVKAINKSALARANAVQGTSTHTKHSPTVTSIPRKKATKNIDYFPLPLQRFNVQVGVRMSIKNGLVCAHTRCIITVATVCACCFTLVGVFTCFFVFCFLCTIYVTVTYWYGVLFLCRASSLSLPPFFRPLLDRSQRGTTADQRITRRCYRLG